MCCGQSRNKLRTANPSRPVTGPAYAKSPQAAPSHVYFVYVGNSGMTVQGPVSGQTYRFDCPGARLEVDARDRILLASLRQLRQVI